MPSCSAAIACMLPDAWLLGRPSSRCLKDLGGDPSSAGGAWHGGLIWACSSAGHALPAAVLEQLVTPAATAVCAAWQAGERGAAGGGILLAEGLARQPAGSEVAAMPAVAAALARLPPLVAADVERVASGEALPQVGTASPLAWLASWAGSLAALGLSLPPASQAQLLACAQRRQGELRPVDLQQLRRAFNAGGHPAALAWLEVLEAQALAS